MSKNMTGKKIYISLFVSITAQALLAIGTETVVEGAYTAENVSLQEWETIFGEFSETDWNESMEQCRDMLAELTEHPLPINTASREKFESIPFLSKDQTEALSYYVYRYGPVLHLSELLLVDGFDEQTLRMLKPFICLGDTLKEPQRRKSLKSILKYGKHELQLSGGRVLQEKQGYIKQVDFEGSSGKLYRGNPWSAATRYGFNYKDMIQWGLVMQKDAGEIMPGKGNLPDYCSFHFALREIGCIKTFLAGDYCLSFGQGLVCGNSFSLGKNLSGSNPEIYGQEIRRHFSTAESGFLRGVATSIYLKKKEPGQKNLKKTSELIFSGFGSYRKLDGNLQDGTFTSISETGLHRTSSETEMQGMIDMTSGGVHLSYNLENAQFGLTGMAWHFSAEYDPEWKPYNNFYFRGRNGVNYSFNYRFRCFRSTFFGEIATDKGGNFAGIGGATLLPYSRMNLSFLARYYSPDYASFYSNAFAEGSGVRNEMGWYSSMEWRIFRYMRLNAFCDFFVFPWLSFGINSPASGSEKGVQLVLQPGQDSEIMIRFKTKTKNENYSTDICKYPDILKVNKCQYRLKYSYKMSGWNFQTTFDLNSIEKMTISKRTWGMALSQTVNYNPEFLDGSLSFRIALFDAANYDNRIFSYEKSLPGSFSMPSLYGLGGRIGICCSFHVTKNISCSLKTGHFVYSDRDNTGTGSEEAEGNRLTDIQALLKWKF